jgi:hypothetical protein
MATTSAPRGAKSSWFDTVAGSTGGGVVLCAGPGAGAVAAARDAVACCVACEAGGWDGGGGDDVLAPGTAAGVVTAARDDVGCGVACGAGGRDAGGGEVLATGGAAGNGVGGRDAGGTVGRAATCGVGTGRSMTAGEDSRTAGTAARFDGTSGACSTEGATAGAGSTRGASGAERDWLLASAGADAGRAMRSRIDVTNATVTTAMTMSPATPSVV